MLKWPVWVGVVCDDLEKQRKFYRDTLGLKEERTGNGFVAFAFEGRLFELIEKSEKPEYDQRRVSFAFEVDDIRTTRTALISRGVEALTEIEGGIEAGQYWAYFRDAEGNLFEIVERVHDAAPTSASASTTD